MTVNRRALKIAIFNVPTSGHVNPTLPLTAALVRRGHEVEYFLSEGYRERIERTGATFTAYRDVSDHYFDELARSFNPARVATHMLRTARGILPQLAEALQRRRPDAVIYDAMCPWGRLAARQASLPTIASMSLLDLPPRYLLKSGETLTAMRLFIHMFPWLLRYRQAAQALTRTHGLPAPAFPQIMNWPGDFNLCYTSPELLPDAGRYGDDYAFVGPLIAPRGEATRSGGGDFPWERIDGQRPLLYISLGTVFTDNPRFFGDCLQAFGDTGEAAGAYQVVMSVGRHVSPDDLEKIPANFVVRSYVPQLEILQRASLFITHAGANSVHEGLYYGVPLLLVPQQLEQALVAARVAELGAGIALNGNSITVRHLRAQAVKVSDDPAFRRRAAAMGEALRTAGGVRRAAEAVEAFCTTRLAA